MPVAQDSALTGYSMLWDATTNTFVNSWPLAQDANSPFPNVRLHTKGIKRFNHPIVGELELSFNRLEVMADPGLMIVAYTAEPGSRSAEAFGLLASWAATRESHWATSSISWSTYGDQIMQYANFLAELCRRSNHGNPLGCRAFRPTRNRCTVV